MKFLQKFYPIILIFVLVIVFFNKTLTGEEIFVTPDFGQSDILHNEYANKYFISQSLKNRQLPLWNPKIATGFPMGGFPTGLFNPINLFLFYFLPMPLAFNLGLAIAFLTASFFTYLFGRSLNLSRPAATAAAITFSFSGVFVTQIVHFSVIQTLSYLPLGLYIAESSFKRKSRGLALLISVAVALVMLTAFYQIALFSLLVFCAYTAWRFLESRHKVPTAIPLFIALGIVLGIAVSSIQLFPSIELTRVSNRASGASKESLEAFPYPFKHIVTFIWPYLLGDPRIGSYPPFSKTWGVFWENTGYVGILPLILAAIAVYPITRAGAKVIFFFLLALVSFILMFGTHSLLFFLYSFPPLSWFRIPARWIAILVFAFSILAAFGIDKTLQKYKERFLASTLIVLIILNLFAFGYGYHARGKTSDWLKTTQTSTFLGQDTTTFRVYTIGNNDVWNKLFLKTGWQKDKNSYIDLLEAPHPNWNLVEGLDQADIYPILITYRFEQIRKILHSEIIKMPQDRYQIQTPAHRILDMQNVKYVISPFRLRASGLKLVHITQTNPPYHIFENTTVLPRAYFVTDYEIADTKQTLKNLALNESFDPKVKVYLEKGPGIKLEEGQNELKITSYRNSEVEIEAKTEKGAILVLSDSYYEGWKAFVGGKLTEIIPANVNQRAIVVSPGHHQIQFKYQSQSFKYGAIVTLLSLSATMFASVYFLKKDKRNRP